jgi:hypothetical protein
MTQNKNDDKKAQIKNEIADHFDIDDEDMMDDFDDLVEEIATNDMKYIQDNFDKVLDFRAGHRTGGRNIADNRLKITMYTLIEDQKYLYRVSGPANIEHYTVSDLKVPQDVVVEDAYDFVNHSTNKDRHNLDDSYEVVKDDYDICKNIEDEFEKALE